MGITEKICSKCKILKPVEFFYKSKKYKTGYKCECKECQKIGWKKHYKSNTDLYRNRQRKTREKSRELGKCIQCHKQYKLENNSLCEVCYFKKCSIRYFGTNKNWKTLKEKFYRQDEKCPYTNRPLILGLNASIDHIIPKAKDSSLYDDITNMEWVHIDINTMKQAFSKEYFINTVEEIYNNITKV